MKELKRCLGSQTLTVYQRIIRLLYRSKSYQAAFALSEHARARVLLDQLGNMPIILSEGGDTDLLQKESLLRKEMAIALITAGAIMITLLFWGNFLSYFKKF